MHAVTIAVSFNDHSAAEAELPGLVSQVSGMPGFVAGYWVQLSPERGIAMVVFESEDAARALVHVVQSAPAGAVTTESVEVGQVMAHA